MYRSDGAPMITTDYMHCFGCGGHFHETDGIKDKEWNPDAKRMDYFRRCPHCNSDMVEPGYSCECCQDYFPMEQINEDGICLECADHMEEVDMFGVATYVGY